MQSIEIEAVKEIAALTGASVDDVIRTAVCRLIDWSYDSQVEEVEKKLIPELQAEVEMVAAGRHGVTIMIAQRRDDELRRRVEIAQGARAIYERAIERVGQMETEFLVSKKRVKRAA